MKEVMQFKNEPCIAGFEGEVKQKQSNAAPKNQKRQDKAPLESSERNIALLKPIFQPNTVDGIKSHILIFRIYKYQVTLNAKKNFMDEIKLRTLR